VESQPLDYSGALKFSQYGFRPNLRQASHLRQMLVGRHAWTLLGGQRIDLGRDCSL
jgi:hypothetical protein